jgi:hypothetical protein
VDTRGRRRADRAYLCSCTRRFLHHGRSVRLGTAGAGRSVCAALSGVAGLFSNNQRRICERHQKQRQFHKQDEHKRVCESARRNRRAAIRCEPLATCGSACAIGRAPGRCASCAGRCRAATHRSDRRDLAFCCTAVWHREWRRGVCPCASARARPARSLRCSGRKCPTRTAAHGGSRAAAWASFHYAVPACSSRATATRCDPSFAGLPRRRNGRRRGKSSVWRARAFGTSCCCTQARGTGGACCARP